MTIRPVAFVPKRVQVTKVVKVTMPILIRLFRIRTVLSKIFGVANKLVITRPFSGCFWLRSVSSSLLNEKKATSEPDTSADPTRRIRSASPLNKK